MSKLEKLKDKAKGLEAKDPKSAIEAWLSVLKAQEEDGEPNPDLSVFNRVGDLYLKVKDPAQAADYYDRAVDKYAELGFHNNAIAMCNKVLRNAPGRQTTYLKLAKLYAAKGFVAEAKQNFGKIQQAFAALKEFTDISPENTQLRGMLEEHLKMYGDAERRPSSRAGVPAPPAEPPQPPEDLSKSGRRKTSSLVFLDVDAPPGARGRPAAPPPPPPPPVERPAPPPEPEPQLETLAQSLVESVTPEPDTSLEIESTNLAEEVEVPAGEGNGGGALLEGLETTSAEFGEVDLDGGEVPSLRDEVTPEPVQPMAQLEPTVPPGADETELEVELEPMLEHEIEIEPPPPPKAAPAKVAPVVPKRPGPPAVPTTPTPPRRPGVGAPPRVGSPKAPGPALHPRAPEPPKVKPVVPKRPATPAAPPAAPERPTRKAVVEVPPLELEPDFDTASTEAGHDVDDQPLAVEDIPPTGGFIQTEEDTSISETRRSAFIDLGRRAGPRDRRAGSRDRGVGEPRQPAAGAASRRRDPPARPQQRAAPAETGGIRLQIGRQGEARRRLPGTGGHTAAAGPAGQGAGRVSARGRARSQERAGEGGARDARARGGVAAGAAARRARETDGAQGRQDEGARRSGGGGRLRRPERHDPGGRTAGTRHSHEGCGRGADGGRGEGLPGDAHPVQTGHRREHRRGGLPIALRSRGRVQGDGVAGRGHCRAAEGAAGARGQAAHLGSPGRVLPREARLRRGGVDLAAWAGTAGLGRSGAARRAVLVGSGARRAGEESGGQRDVRPRLRGGYPVQGRRRAKQGARQGEMT